MYLGKLRKRGDVVLGVADALNVDRLRLLVDRLLKVRGVGGRDELDMDVELLQEDCDRLSDIWRALGPSRRAHL